MPIDYLICHDTVNGSSVHVGNVTYRTGFQLDISILMTAVFVHSQIIPGTTMHCDSVKTQSTVRGRLIQEKFASLGDMSGLIQRPVQH